MNILNFFCETLIQQAMCTSVPDLSKWCDGLTTGLVFVFSIFEELSNLSSDWDDFIIVAI